MQFEELRQQWQRLDQKLEQSLIIESELLRQSVVRPVGRRMNRSAIWPVIDVTFCVGVLLFAGAFLGNHWPDWPLVAPSAAVMAAAVVLLIDSIRQLAQVCQLDWSGPVAEIQSALQRLRVAKIRQFKWIILLSPLGGFCVLIVGVQWLFDWLTGFQVSIFEKVDPWWIAANYGFGLLFIPLGYAVARILAKRFHGRRLWQNILDDIAGHSLKAATQEIERWASLQRESSAEERCQSRST